MSSYAPDPYVYGIVNTPKSPGVACQDVNAYLSDLKALFEEAGWEVTDLPGMSIIEMYRTGFEQCTLGKADWAFYAVSMGDATIATMDSSMGFEKGECCEFLTDYCECLAGYFTGNHINPNPLAAAGTGKMQTLVNIIKVLSLITNTSFVEGEESLNPITGAREKKIYYPGNGNCQPALTFGGQLYTTVLGIPRVRGAGFIVKSRAHTSDNNYLEAYITYKHAGVSADLNVHVHTSGWPNFQLVEKVAVEPEIIGMICPTMEYEYFGLYTPQGKHPLETLENPDESTNISTLSIPLNGEVAEIFANSYSFIMNPHGASTGASAGLLMAAPKIKRLENESKLIPPNIRRMLIYVDRTGGGTTLRDKLGLEQSHSLTRLSTVTGNNDRYLTGAGGNWGPLLLTGVGDNVDYTTQREGIQWIGGIAEMGEPWLACNFFNNAVDTIAPVVGQFWDAIIPYRAVSGVSSELGLFYWDDQFWRYYQTNKLIPTGGYDPGIGPPSSMAFRVRDGQIFGGGESRGYTLATIASITCTPSPWVAGTEFLSITVIINPSSEDKMCAIYAVEDGRVILPSSILLFPTGVVDATFFAQVKDPEIDSLTTIRARGTNTKTASLVFVKP